MKAPEWIAFGAVLVALVAVIGTIVSAVLTYRGAARAQARQVVQDRYVQFYIEIAEFVAEVRGSVPVWIDNQTPLDNARFRALQQRLPAIGGRIGVLAPGQLDEDWSGVVAIVNLLERRSRTTTDTDMEWRLAGAEPIGQILDTLRYLLGDLQRPVRSERRAWWKMWRSQNQQPDPHSWLRR